jgi:hypothetical protein
VELHSRPSHTKEKAQKAEYSTIPTESQQEKIVINKYTSKDRHQ